MNYNNTISARDFVRTQFGTARVIAAHIYTLNVKFIDGPHAGKEACLEYDDDITKIEAVVCGKLNLNDKRLCEYDETYLAMKDNPNFIDDIKKIREIIR